jgi:putative spermidine/putrescine transport system permease protein
MMRFAAVRWRQPRFGRMLLGAFCMLVFAFLVLPILAIVPLSLNPGTFLAFPREGLSLRWYEALLQSPQWGAALQNSLFVAAATTSIATPLGVLAAIGLWRTRSRAAALLLAVMSAPLLVPVVVVAIAFYFLFAPLGLTNSYAGLVLAHTALASPFVLIVVHVSLHGLNADLLRAGASLGAPPRLVFTRILLPLIAPGVVAGAVFAFMTSFDETVAALFIAGPHQRTLPMQMFDGVREQISPAITAAATLLVIASALLMGTAEMLRRRGEALYGRERVGNGGK